MWQLLLKGIISGAIVVAASEVSRRSPLWAAVLVSLPLMSMLVLTWLYVDTRSSQAVIDLSWSIMWIVLPSIVFFAALPIALRGGVGFPVAMAGATIVMVAAYAAYGAVLVRLGVTPGS